MQKEILKKFGLSFNEKVEGKILEVDDIYIFGYVIVDLVYMPCMWCPSGECILNQELVPKYDLIKVDK